MKTTTQSIPEDKGWLSEAEMNSLSAAYMLAIIALVVGIGIYAMYEALNGFYKRYQIRKGIKSMEKIIELIKQQEQQEKERGKIK